MDLDKLTMGDKIMAGAGILLVIGLFALPWHKVSFFGMSTTVNALGSPNGFWGILALILALAVVGTLLAERLGGVSLPEIPISWTDARFFAGIATVALLLLKLILETDFLGFGAYVNILLAAGLAYGGFAARSESASGPSGTPPSPF